MKTHGMIDGERRVEQERWIAIVDEHCRGGEDEETGAKREGRMEVED